MSAPSKKDIHASLAFATRIAIDNAISFDDLSAMLRTAYAEAEKVGKSQDVSNGKSFEPVRVGLFVVYVSAEPGRKGTHDAHVLELRGADRIKLRAHRTAQPNIDVDDVPYSAKPKAGHWSYRERVGSNDIDISTTNS